jgi:hypothetical protein
LSGRRSIDSGTVLLDDRLQEFVVFFAGVLSLRDRHAFYETVRARGLVSLGPDIPAMAQQGAVYIDKIIHGANPADLPVQQPTQYVLHINLKTAKTLGLEIPPTLLAGADELIE